ncbi:hypothetical protein D9756_005207 [Leucocoprinus leucothites]|uniref:TOG domain-containing protein n=1 Tax=Leucocoprinus leucothites TaxID=201217 RepID=A0A8H5G046_9AGAR|nr:hypothetical protein D9756_005207 [Leucoagaricus leucothites]
MNTNNASLTPQEFVQSFEKLKHSLSLPDSEETWDQISNGLQKLGQLCQSGAFEHAAEVVFSFRSIHRSLIGAMNSERTRLSGAALDVLTAVASGLGIEFEPLLPLFFPSLLSLCGRTNKVVITRARTCIFTIVEATQLPGIINYFTQFSKDKSPTVRLVVAEATLSCLKCFNPPTLEKESVSLAIESLIRNAARDPNADVRKVGKDVFQSYKVLLPDRVESFAAPLTPTIRKYLQLSAGNAKLHKKVTSVISEPGPVSRANAQGSRLQSTTMSGPVRPSNNPPNTSKSVASARSLEPSRTIQLPAKRALVNPSAGPPPQKSSSVASRPFAQAKNATGPQRVIKPAVHSTAGLSNLSTDKRDVKVPAVRLGGLSRSRVASSSSLASSSGSQAAVRPVKQLPATRGLPTNAKLPGESEATSTAARNLSRPTLSQLARVRPPVTKPIPKVVRGLEVRKTGTVASVGSKGSIAAQRPTLSTKARAANVPVGRSKALRPITPTSIPLPPSPKLSASESSTSTPGSSDSKIFEEPKPEPQPELVVVPAGGVASSQVFSGIESPASTPTVHPIHVPDVDLALKTPISALLSSIQHGFDLTPCSPLSPPQDYLASSNTPLEGGPFRLGILKQNISAGAQS